MKAKLLVYILAAFCLIVLGAGSAWSATAVVKPDQLGNGATDIPSNNVIHARFEITLAGTIGDAAGDDLTITPPTGVTFKTGTFFQTVNPGTSTLFPLTAGTQNASSFGVEIGGAGQGAAGNVIILEVDLVTPFTFSSTGAKTFTVAFEPTLSWTENTTAAVTLKNDQRLTYISFTSPSGSDDTTSAEGTGFKVTFSGSLPDLVHDDNSKTLNNPNGSNSQVTTGALTGNGTDDYDDMLYRFWVSTDSSLIRSSQGGTLVNILEMKRVPTNVTNAILAAAYDRDNGGGADYEATPYGLAQNPTVVPATTLTELFTTRFADATLEGLIDTRGLPEGKFYVYISSDKTSDYFLGRSDALVVRHAPGFLAAAWDKNKTGGTAFTSNNIVETTVDAASNYDAQNTTLDSGNLYDWDGTRNASEIATSNVISNVNLTFRAVDYDNPTARVWIFLSTNSGLDTTKLVTTGAAPNRVITGLTGARLVSRSDTLRVGVRSHSFIPENSISVLGTDTTYVAAGDYTVYFAATDGTNLTLEKASDVSTSLSKTPLTLSVKHSPTMTPDPLAFDDGGGDNDLDLNTGVAASTAKPQRYVSITWEQKGLNGDKDVDDNASIDLYYADTALNYTTAAGLLAAIGTAADVHKINSTSISENPDGLFQNHYDWDLWTYKSPDAAQTVPTAATQYEIYAVITGGSTSRLVKWDNSGAGGAVQFTHSSYVRPVLPARDITVGPDDALTFSWEAADVDNNSTAPDIQIILSPTDYGATSTFATLNVGTWVANSGDGDNAGNIVRLREGTDTSFVFVANRMTIDIAATASCPIQAGTYYAYIMINNNAANAAATPFMANADFAYRFPGKIVLTQAATTTPTNARFIFPRQIAASSGDEVRIPIMADDAGLTVGQVNIFVSVDTTYFEPIDKDPATANVQPFTIGSSATASEVIGNLASRSSNGKWYLDLVYAKPTGFTWITSTTPIAYLNLRAKDISSGFVNTAITLENDPAGRQTSLYRSNGTIVTTRIGTEIPAPCNARIDARGSIAGTIPLQGRTTMTMPYSEVKIFLRLGSSRGGTAAGTQDQAGGFDSLSDATFVAANDSSASVAGINIPLPANGDFTLRKVPAGDYTLVAWVDRYLAGYREVSVKPGEGVTGIQPTLDGSGTERTQLLAGDAAGYDDDGNSATVSKPNNFVDDSDLTAISNALFATSSSSTWNTYADVDGSGRVDGLDYNYALANQCAVNGGTGKIIPVKPIFGPKPAVMAGSNKDAALSLIAAPAGVRPGETFDVAVQVKGAVSARAYEFHLGYDPSRMVPEGVVSTGDLLARYSVSVASKDLGGDYGVTGGALGLVPGASGDGSLATVRFRALQGGAAEISLLDGFLVNSDQKAEKPKMESGIALDVAAGPMKLHDASGAEVLGLIVLDGHARVDFTDFFAFAEAFGSKSGSANFNGLADLNADGAVDFNDFFVFADNFGKAVVDVPAAARRSSKPVGADFQGSLSIAALAAVRPGETVTLEATLAGAAAKGVGFVVSYDPSKYEFVEVAKSGEELFLARPDGEGRISVARAVDGTLDGTVARLVFRAKGEFEQPGRFQIADALVLSPEGMQSKVVGNSLDLATVPSKFALAQNFPNPFNPETTIKYSLADDAQVGLRIYNIVGQVIRTLVQEKQAAGRYSIRWDGRDDRGLTVSSGIYFYQITAGSFKDVRKLMLLK